MQIKDLPEAERPQEKLLYAGPSALSNSELLALVIRTGTSDKSAIQLAEEVIAYASTNTGYLGRTDARELMTIDGIGEAKACSVVAAIELSRRLMSDGVRETVKKVSSGDDVAEMLMQELMYENRELFVSLFLNTKLQIESKSIISIGSLDTAPVHPREVFGPAARRGAAAVIVAHNHPSGDPTPSPEDIAVTGRLLDASQIMGIKLLDHVIIGRGRFTSLKSEGLIPD